MSWRPSFWIAGHSEVEGPLRLVCLILALNADESGRGRMRRARLAEQTTLSPEHVDSAMNALYTRGIIEGKREYSRYSYRFLIPGDYYPDGVQSGDQRVKEPS